jgi:NitT/TauT family transport system permease protein
MKDFTIVSNPNLYVLLGIGLLLLVWQLLSLITHELIIASPADTLLALGMMVQTGAFWKNLGITLERFGLSLLFGCLVGFILGLIAGLKQNVRRVLEPMRWLLMSVPPVVLVVVCMIWFGMGSAQTIFATSLLILPIMYVNTIAGIESVESQILEMGRVYRANFTMLLKEIYLPGIGGPVLAGLTLSAGLAVRIVVLAEVLGAYSGVGYAFSVARINLETPELFAWVIVCLFMVILFEFGILNPVKNRIMHWKNEVER